MDVAPAAGLQAPVFYGAVDSKRYILEATGCGCAFIDYDNDGWVAATLVHRAVGDQLTCVFVNNGLLRKEEPERVLDVMHGNLDMNIRYVDATDRFLAALSGVIDPEQKRRSWAGSSSPCSRPRRRASGRIDFLAQGTSIPTSSSRPRRRRGDRVQDQDPPQRGRAAAWPAHSSSSSRCATSSRTRCGRSGWSWACPRRWFTGSLSPDLDWRSGCLGEVTAERLEILRNADWVVVDEIKRNGLYRQVWQSFAVLTPLETVGVMGDFRTYANVVAVRVVTSEDAMTADWARFLTRCWPGSATGSSTRSRASTGSSSISREAPGHDRVGVAELNLDPAWRKSMIAGLLSGQHADGGFGVHPYSKWTGAHWRLVSLIELGVPRRNARARAAAKTVLDWIAAPSEPRIIAGLERRHASMEGNALAVCCRLGMAGNKRVRHLVDVLVRSQWPDGGWNCDVGPDAHRSSFHESLAPIWGLVEYNRETGDGRARIAARRGVELLLEHRLFRSIVTRRPIHPEWLHVHWPHYWHYDYFHGLRAVASLRLLADPRVDDALEMLRSARRADGTWQVSGHRYWRPSTEVVDWGDAHEIVTAHARAMLQ